MRGERYVRAAQRRARNWRRHGLRLVNRLYRPRVLLYTDSRGTNLPEHEEYEHYGARLERQFSVDAWYCPEKWTTTLDFFALLQTIDLTPYQAVILHTGIVDASPRSRRDLLTRIYPSKRRTFDQVFGAARAQAHLEGDLGCDYEGDKTNNMYSLEMAVEFVIPRLLAIPNLLWISSNRFVPGWRGNYWRDRPANIRLIEDYSAAFAARLPAVIDLFDWGPADVQRYTYDNLHPTREGSDEIYRRIMRHLGGSE